MTLRSTCRGGFHIRPLVYLSIACKRADMESAPTNKNGGKKGAVFTAPLGSLYELLPAFGTGDGDLTLSFGDSHLLTASGTIVIAVFLVFEFLEKD